MKNEDASGKEEEDAELEQEFAKVAPRQCVVERLVPDVQSDLDVGGGADDRECGEHQNDQGIADRTFEVGARQTHELGDQPAVGISLILVSRDCACHGPYDASIEPWAPCRTCRTEICHTICWFSGESQMGL
jgi:hypothetical protein